MDATIIYPETFHEPVVFAFPITERVHGNSVWDMLEKIWRECNHVDGSEWIANKDYRSMSVGDMVLINGKLYAAMKEGFIELP